MPYSPPLNSTRIDPNSWHVIQEGFNFFGHWGNFYVRVTSRNPRSGEPFIRINSSVPPWHAEIGLNFDQIHQIHRWGNYYKVQVYNPGPETVFLEIDP